MEKDVGLGSYLWLDANIAYDLGCLTIYAGLVRQLGDFQKDIVTQPMYISLSSSLPLSKINLISDIQFATGKFTDLYKEPSYRSFTFSVKAEYDYRLIHPNLNLSLSKLFLESDPGTVNNFNDNLSFNIGAGFTFGTSSTTNCSQVIRSKGQVLVRKPNIYLYPSESCSVRVTVEPNGTITKSIPEYNDGWYVHISPDGTIDDSLKYLFYEANLNIDFPNEGWCVAIDKTWPFLKNTLDHYGLNDDEIDDFLTYWSSELPISKYYSIYPLINKQIDKYCPIEINPTPDKILRLWLIFDPQESETKLKAPEIPGFHREGFTTIEWGGIVIDNK